jgi:predicted kinase
MIATMILGLPGSGKSTLAKTIGGVIINRDAMRTMIYGQYDFRREDERMLIEMAHACVKCVADHKQDVIIDETGANVGTRIGWVEHLKGLGYKVNAIYLDTPVEICMSRRHDDNKGLNQDWDKIILAMKDGWKHPQLNEGYDNLRVIK